MIDQVIRRYSKLRSFVPGTFDSLQGKTDDLKVFDSSKPTTFYHSGDFGDIIYALPTIKAMGGGELFIGPETKTGFQIKARQRFTKPVFELIAPLLKVQPYLRRVQYADKMPKVDVDLNQFRRYFLEEPERLRKGDRRLNLAEAHLHTFHQRLKACQEPWLVVDRVGKPDKPVLIHRSARWRNSEFPWAQVMEIHGHQAAFVGLKSEYEKFAAEWGDLPFIETFHFLALARLIAGCQLFIGNQSAPYSIAEGLKKNTLLEVWPEGPNCIFPRENAYYGDGSAVYIPKLAMTMTKEVRPCPMCHREHNPQPVRTRADIVLCDHCQTVYLRTRPSVESMEARYQTYADGSSHMRLPLTIEEMRSSGLRREYFMELVQKHDALKCSLLDIGCGWGAFLANARDKGYSVAGVEICTKMANFARSVMGIPVYAQQLEACPFHAEQFSVITAIHSFEHLPDQAEAMRQIRKLLPSGGLFCGIVPNFDSLCSKEMRDNWAWLDPEMHYVHFTPASLTKCLTNWGFNVIEMTTHTGDYDAQAVAELVRKERNMPMPTEEIAARLEEHWKLMEGEEIRFFARRI